MIQMSDRRYFGRGHVPVGIGAVLKGWDVGEEHYRSKLAVVDFRAMTGACPHNCFHCFTNKDKRTLTLPQIIDAIDQIADMGAYAVNYLGEGEPTIDPWLLEIVAHTQKRGLVPVVFTEASIMLRDRDLVRSLKNLGATICPKCDSIFNREYQHWVLRHKKNVYFEQRKEAIEMLIDEGFNAPASDGTTRLGFDMVVSSRNIEEVPDTLRWCRERNIWIVFSTFLPSGRSAMDDFDRGLPANEGALVKMRESVIAIDREFGFEHDQWNNFMTTPCVEKIQIFGDGRVSPCPGNEFIVGNMLETPLQQIFERMLQRFPFHDPRVFDGQCAYRPAIPGMYPLTFHRTIA